jgi:hypothetical protein
VFVSVLWFAQAQKERIQKGEISHATLRNYIKAEVEQIEDKVKEKEEKEEKEKNGAQSGERRINEKVTGLHNKII